MTQHVFVTPGRGPGKTLIVQAKTKKVAEQKLSTEGHGDGTLSYRGTLSDVQSKGIFEIYQ